MSGSTRSWRRSLAEQMPSVVARVSPLGARTSRRLAGAIQGQRPRYCPGAIDRFAPCSSDGRGRQCQSRLISIGSSRPVKVRINIDQEQARLLGLSSQVLARGSEHRDDGNADHASARRHLSRRRHRAGEGRTARLAVDPARPAAAAPERPHGTAEPDRELSNSIRNIR